MAWACWKDARRANYAIRIGRATRGSLDRLLVCVWTGSANFQEQGRSERANEVVCRGTVWRQLHTYGVDERLALFDFARTGPEVDVGSIFRRSRREAIAGGCAFES